MLKRINPIVNINDILKIVDNFKLIQDKNNRVVYKITLDSKKKIGPLVLQKGTYIYKYEDREFNKRNINYFHELSDNELIPKIYLMHNNYLIQQYIRSITLRQLLFQKPSLSEKKEIFSKIERLLAIWHSSGFAHGDFNANNILIDAFNNVWFIDPYPYPDFDYNLREDNIWIQKVKKEIFGK